MFVLVFPCSCVVYTVDIEEIHPHNLSDASIIMHLLPTLPIYVHKVCIGTSYTYILAISTFYMLLLTWVLRILLPK